MRVKYKNECYFDSIDTEDKAIWQKFRKCTTTINSR